VNLENYTRTKPEIGLCRQSKHTLVADRKPIIEISYEISQLIISQSNFRGLLPLFYKLFSIFNAWFLYSFQGLNHIAHVGSLKQ